MIETFVKNLSKLLLLALIPTLLVIKFEWNAILPIIIYLQLLLIWAQAEIGLRQHILFSVQFDPAFNVEIKKRTSCSKLSMFLINVSKNPAYTIMVSRVLDERRNPIPPNIWKNKVYSTLITGLAPGQKSWLCSFDENVINNGWVIEVSYATQLGDLKEIYISFEDKKPLIILGIKQKPGILLSTLEYFALFPKYVKLKRQLRIMVR